MPGRLSDDHMDQLESFIGTGPKTFRLLYSFTRDGCGNQPFHSKCDNQGPTVTVVYNPQGSVCGGYTSLAWQSSGDWKQDDQAFLFQLAFSNQKLCRKFPSKHTVNGVYHNSLYGPFLEVVLPCHYSVILITICILSTACFRCQRLAVK